MYRDAARMDVLKFNRSLRKANIKNAVATSKMIEGNLRTYARALVPNSERCFANEPKTQKI